MQLTFYAVCDWNYSQLSQVLYHRLFFINPGLPCWTVGIVHCVCFYTYEFLAFSIFLCKRDARLLYVFYKRNCKNKDNIVNITEEERRKYKLPTKRAQTVLFFADLYSWYLFEENRNSMMPIAGSSNIQYGTLGLQLASGNRNLMILISGSEVQQHTARYTGAPAIARRNRNMMITVSGSEVQQHTVRYPGAPATQQKQKYDDNCFRL